MTFTAKEKKVIRRCDTPDKIQSFLLSMPYAYEGKEERERTTLSSNGLEIVERIMPTEAVVIAKQCYTVDDFRRMLGNPRKMETRTITIGNMSEIEVVKYRNE